MKDILEMQNKLFSSLSLDNNPFNAFNFFAKFNNFSDLAKITENNLKFHNAAIKYHSAIVEMGEAIKDNMEIINKK